MPERTPANAHLDPLTTTPSFHPAGFRVLQSVRCRLFRTPLYQSTAEEAVRAERGAVLHGSRLRTLAASSALVPAAPASKKKNRH